MQEAGAQNCTQTSIFFQLSGKILKSFGLLKKKNKHENLKEGKL